MSSVQIVDGSIHVSGDVVANSTVTSADIVTMGDLKTITDNLASQIKDLVDVFKSEIDKRSKWYMSDKDQLYEAVYLWKQELKGEANSGDFELKYGVNHIGKLDVSGVKNFNRLFQDNDGFNSDISGWDVSGATSMYGMFQFNSAFNQDISGWDVSSVTNARGMFHEEFPDEYKPAFRFVMSSKEQLKEAVDLWQQELKGEASPGDFQLKYAVDHISKLDVESITDFSYLFADTDFNTPILVNGWNLEQATNLEGMFENASEFNQMLPRLFGDSRVINIKNMFKNASSFHNNHDLIQKLFAEIQQAHADSEVAGVIAGADMSSYGHPLPYVFNERGWTMELFTASK